MGTAFRKEKLVETESSGSDNGIKEQRLLPSCLLFQEEALELWDEGKNGRIAHREVENVCVYISVGNKFRKDQMKIVDGKDVIPEDTLKTKCGGCVILSHEYCLVSSHCFVSQRWIVPRGNSKQIKQERGFVFWGQHGKDRVKECRSQGWVDLVKCDAQVRKGQAVEVNSTFSMVIPKISALLKKIAPPQHLFGADMTLCRVKVGKFPDDVLKTLKIPTRQTFEKLFFFARNLGENENKEGVNYETIMRLSQMILLHSDFPSVPRSSEKKIGDDRFRRMLTTMVSWSWEHTEPHANGSVDSDKDGSERQKRKNPPQTTRKDIDSENNGDVDTDEGTSHFQKKKTKSPEKARKKHQTRVPSSPYHVFQDAEKTKPEKSDEKTGREGEKEKKKDSTDDEGRIKRAKLFREGRESKLGTINDIVSIYDVNLFFANWNERDQVPSAVHSETLDVTESEWKQYGQFMPWCDGVVFSGFSGTCVCPCFGAKTMNDDAILGLISPQTSRECFDMFVGTIVSGVGRDKKEKETEKKKEKEEKGEKEKDDQKVYERYNYEGFRYSSTSSFMRVYMLVVYDDLVKFLEKKCEKKKKTRHFARKLRILKRLKPCFEKVQKEAKEFQKESS